MSAYQTYEKKCVFNNESVKLTNEGCNVLNVPVFDIFLRQEMFYLSIVLFVSGVKEPNIDTKLDELNAYQNNISRFSQDCRSDNLSSKATLIVNHNLYVGWRWSKACI